MEKINFYKDILDKYVLPNESIVSWRIIDKQVIFLHKEERCFYELNETASFIWKKAAGKAPLKKIISLLSSNYDIDRQAAEVDTLAFIKELLNRKIFIVQ